MNEQREIPSMEILLVDDDGDFRKSLTRGLIRRGHAVVDAGSAEEALAILASRDLDVILCDMNMPGMSGLDLLKKLGPEDRGEEIVMLTGAGTVKTAVEAMKLGAFDYLTKPVEIDELAVLLAKAAATARLRRENLRLKDFITRTRPRFNMVGESPSMQELYRLIQRVGPSDQAILIQGESGTGKELVSLALHQASPRADRPMVVVNCAALPEQLLESELFGHEKGAFTGATTTKPGLFEVADEGTLFIDEIGELAQPLQAKLLRVLEDGSLRRLGSTRMRKVNVRLLTATNRDMEEEIESGRFRQDLYYRIEVMTIHLPPLRERSKTDINLLATHFAGEEWTLEPAARDALEQYQWPGNVRQLRNAIERAKLLADDETITLRNLPPGVTDALQDAPPEPDGDPASLERARILRMLTQEGGNKSRCARALGVSRRTMYRLLERYEIEL